jgi:type IV secretion system protein VirD4
LTGERYEQVPTWDDDGALTAVSTRRVPVLSAAQIAQLRARHVVVIRRGMPPAVGKVQMAWKRRDVRRTKRAMMRAERFERWAVAWDRAAEWAAAQMEAAAGRVGVLMDRLDGTYIERAARTKAGDPTKPDRGDRA